MSGRKPRKESKWEYTMGKINLQKEALRIMGKIYKNVQNKPWTCMCSGCDSPAINSHLLMRNGILNYVVEDGHLFELRSDYPEAFQKGKMPVSFKKVGINQSISFPLFCNEHDTSLFKEIEDLQPQFSKESCNEGQSPFSQMSRVLSEDDLKSPITARFLLSQFDEYQELKSVHEKLRTEFYAKDKLCAVYEEKRNKLIAFEVLSSAMLAIGPLLLGILSYLVPNHGWELTTIIVLIAGVLILLGGIIAKCFMKP